MKLQILLSLSFFLLAGCNGNGVNRKLKNDKRVEQPAEKKIEFVKSMRLKSPRRGDLFTYGEEIEIMVHLKKKAGDIDSLQLWGDGELMNTISEKPWILKWTPKKENMGKHNLKLMAYHENGTIGIVSTYINLKSNQAPDEYDFEVVNSFPHDKRAYTQGLFYHDGFLYEGTGQHGESTLRKVKLENGEALSIMALEQEYFGEGITYHEGKIIQLTWNSGKAFVMDVESFIQTDTFYPETNNKQCWGITTVNNELVISNGTNVLTFFNPYNYNKLRTVEVYDNSGMVTNLNELEYVNGKIYANVWMTDRIVIINPETGRVEGNLNLGSILKVSERKKLVEGDEVLNGIAWDSINGRMFVTGKRWPKLFEVKISKK